MIGKSGECYSYECYKGNDIHVILPDQIESLPVTVIGPKAFLSCRTVERLELPDTIEQIGDWGFAHMKNLKELVFPSKKIQFGKKVFLGCESLERIFLRDVRNLYEGIPLFLASQARWMDEIPLDLVLAGDVEGQWQWLNIYDRGLLGFLGRPDDTGFEPAFIGWFDVEDVDDQRQKYVLERKKCKIRLVFERLRYPQGLSQDIRRKLGEYLLGTEIAPLFLKLCQEEVFGQEVQYFQIWQQIGGFSLYSPQFLLEQLPEAAPEVRGFLMKCCLPGAGEWTEDFFEQMEL